MRSLLLLLFVFQATYGFTIQTQYKDFITTQEHIYALTEDGELKIFDKSTARLIKENVEDSFKIQLITKDAQDNLVILDTKNRIKRYNLKRNTWKLITKTKNTVSGIVFNSKNECYIVTDKGIERAKNHTLYFSNKTLNRQTRIIDSWGTPYCYYMDTNDKIWIGFGYGEWGGNLFIFNTTNHTFETPDLGTFRISLSPIKSFFEDESSVYLSSGLQHMMNSGSIIKFDNLKASTLLKSDSHWKNPNAKNQDKVWVSAEYIGPATYNKHTKSFYFYSQKGIFKGDKSKDLTDINNWEVIFKPKLQWEYGQRDAVGSPMNVLKLEILSKEKLIFLSQKDGIGYYDGTTLKMLE